MGLIWTQAPTDAHLLLPESLASTVRAKILRPALGLPCSYPHALAMEPRILAFVALDHEFAVVLLIYDTNKYTSSGPPNNFLLHQGGDLSGMTWFTTSDPVGPKSDPVMVRRQLLLYDYSRSLPR